jgi:ribosomal-protein-alanine acetyltransferase
MSVTIRLAVLNEVPALLAMEREAASAAHWSLDQYERRMADGMVLVAEELIAEQEKRLSGFLCAREIAGEWEIENVVVAQRARRRGCGDQLLLELLRRARAQAGVVVWLEVRESNQPARLLYEKHGFRQTGRRREYYRNPLEDGVLYGLRFAE